jgi:hypothetical protein
LLSFSMQFAVFPYSQSTEDKAKWPAKS